MVNLVGLFTHETQGFNMMPCGVSWYKPKNNYIDKFDFMVSTLKQVYRQVGFHGISQTAIISTSWRVYRDIALGSVEHHLKGVNKPPVVADHTHTHSRFLLDP